MTNPFRFVRTPGSVDDFTIDWTSWLAAGDVITESSWTATDGLTVVQDSLSNTTTTVWLSGGTAGSGLVESFYPFSAECTYYHATNSVRSANGRTDERTLTLVTKEL